MSIRTIACREDAERVTEDGCGHPWFGEDDNGRTVTRHLPGWCAACDEIISAFIPDDDPYWDIP